MRSVVGRADVLDSDFRSLVRISHKTFGATDVAHALLRAASPLLATLAER